MMRRPGNSRLALACAALALLVALAFWPVVGFDFVGFDDERYVTDNRFVQGGITTEGLRWAWTSFHAANWHPLTWMSHMADRQFLGPAATGPHVTNLLLHMANTLLLFLLLARTTGSSARALLVAVLFGIHPLHVESVAWVAERKDVLSTLFWLLTIGAYAHFVRKPGAARYLLVLASFALGLLSKPMLVTLPLTLLLFDVWPLARVAPQTPWRVGGWKLVLEKLPLVLLAAGSSVVTLAAQRAGGAVASLESHPMVVRVANALVSYAAYLGKSVWPVGLAVPYPHPGTDLPAWKPLAASALLVAVTIAVWRVRRERPYLAFGWLWFLVTLVPVIGLVQVGPQAMADRYTYVPLIGLFVMLAWSLPSAVGPLGAAPDRSRAIRRETAPLAMTFVLVPVLTVATWMQLRHWQDDATLARRALAVTTDNAVAHNQLGLALIRRGQPGDALAQYNAALDISPRFAEAHNNVGGALVELGRDREAIAAYGEALRIKPAYPEALLNLGVALARQGRLDESALRFEEALRLRPDYGKAHANLAAVRLSQGDSEGALREIEQARRFGFAPPPGLVEAIEALRRER